MKYIVLILIVGVLVWSVKGLITDIKRAKKVKKKKDEQNRKEEQSKDEP